MGTEKRRIFVPPILVRWIITFLLGGTVTIGGITVENPLQDEIRSVLITDEYVFKSIESFHAITSVLTEVGNEGQLLKATLTGGSSRAAKLFGFEAANVEGKLAGKSGTEAVKILGKYMDKEDYEAFVDDQIEVFKNYGDGKLAIAKIPVLFNEKHQYYKNEAFLPVIVNLGRKTRKEEDRSERLILIAYLRMEILVPAVREYLDRMKEKGG